MKTYYRDYEPDAIRKCPDMVDTFVVAEASIYSPDDTPKIGLYFTVTKQDLVSSGITMEAAIAGAREVRPSIVEEWQERLGEQEQTMQVVYTWRGDYVAERPAKP
ncbi:MAG: hypothetical protein ACE5IQ_04745 [Candidatus Methylomirabilales bacterium]